MSKLLKHQMELIESTPNRRTWRCSVCDRTRIHVAGLVRSPDLPEWEDEPYPESDNKTSCDLDKTIAKLQAKLEKLILLRNEINEQL